MGLFDFLRKAPIDPSKAAAVEKPVAVPTPLESFFTALLKYGIENDEAMIPRLREMYATVLPDMTEQQRIELVMQVAELMEARRISVNPFNVFLFEDPAPRVVASAVMNALQMWPTTTSENPLGGAREILGFARGAIEQREELRAAGMIQGLLLLGDRRLAELVGQSWRGLSSAGRLALSELEGLRVYAPVVDWLIDWLEESEGREFGWVAGALARMGKQARVLDGVFELRRALPLWVEPPEPPITELQRWTHAEFAERIAPRLREVARLEEGDRVMSDVLTEWGISLDGVASDAENEALLAAMTESRRHRGSIPPEAYRESVAFPGVTISLDEILARQPVALIAWGIFNPYGPTLNVIGRTRGRDVDLVWYVMLNPFAQEAAVMGSLTGRDRLDGEVLLGQVAQALSANRIEMASGKTLPLVTNPPCFVITHDNERPDGIELLNALVQSPGVREGNLYERLRCLERTGGNPWDRATEQLHGRTTNIRDGDAPTADDAEVLAWVREALARDQQLRELIGFQEAWDGSINNLRKNGNAAMANAAMTAEAFDYFTGSVGLPHFTMISEAKRRADS